MSNGSESGDSNPKKVPERQDPASETSTLLLDTDGRRKGEIDTRYAAKHHAQIRFESRYLFALFIVALLAIGCLLRTDSTTFGCPAHAPSNCAWFRHLHYLFGGMLGGTLFALKWMYHSVARFIWNEDRKLWRLLSPWIAAGMAAAFGLLIDAGIIKGLMNERFAEAGGNYPGLAAIGFFVGYFSDSAASKLNELAVVLFGATKERKT